MSAGLRSASNTAITVSATIRTISQGWFSAHRMTADSMTPIRTGAGVQGGRRPPS